MSDLAIKAGEVGVIRVFTLHMPDRDLQRLTEPDKHDPNPQASVAMLVGLDWLTEGGFEIFEPSVLGDLGLSGYLVDGGGVDIAALATDAVRLDAIDDPVLILYSRAFGPNPATLLPSAGVTFIGAYHEARAPVQFETLPAKAANGLTGTAPQTPVARSPHKTLLLALLALPLVALLIGLMVLWILR